MLPTPAGGELVLTVFEKRLPESIEKQPFKKILDVGYVKRVIEEADGIQPHLVAPEAGYRRLLEEALGYLKDPTEKSVEEVSGHPWWPPGRHAHRCAAQLAPPASPAQRGPTLLAPAPASAHPPRPQVFVLLRRMVDNVANSDEVRALRRYPTLRREIVTAAYRALEKFKVGREGQPGRCLVAVGRCGRLPGSPPTPATLPGLPVPAFELQMCAGANCSCSCPALLLPCRRTHARW